MPAARDHDAIADLAATSRALLRALPGAGRGGRRGLPRPRRGADQARRGAGPAGGAGGLAGGLAGPPPAAAGARADPGVRRLARDRAPGRLGLSRPRSPTRWWRTSPPAAPRSTSWRGSPGAELRVIPVGQGRPAHDFTTQPGDERGGLRARDRDRPRRRARRTSTCWRSARWASATPRPRPRWPRPSPARPAAAGPGPGTGPRSRRACARKAAVIDAGLDRHRAAMTDPLEILRHVGGREHAAMLGAVLGARLRRVPVLLDGFTATVPGALLQALAPGADRPLPGRPLLGRAGPSPAAGADRHAAAARPRHAAGRGLGRRAGDPARCAPPSPATPAWRPSPSARVSQLVQLSSARLMPGCRLRTRRPAPPAAAAAARSRLDLSGGPVQTPSRRHHRCSQMKRSRRVLRRSSQPRDARRGRGDRRQRTGDSRSLGLGPRSGRGTVRPRGTRAHSGTRGRASRRRRGRAGSGSSSSIWR